MLLSSCFLLVLIRTCLVRINVWVQFCCRVQDLCLRRREKASHGMQLRFLIHNFSIPVPKVYMHNWIFQIEILEITCFTMGCSLCSFWPWALYPRLGWCWIKLEFCYKICILLIFSPFMEVKKSIVLSIVFGFLHFFRDCLLSCSPCFAKGINATSGCSRGQACRVKAIRIEGKKCGWELLLGSIFTLLFFLHSIVCSEIANKFNTQNIWTICKLEDGKRCWLPLS